MFHQAQPLRHEQIVSGVRGVYEGGRPVPHVFEEAAEQQDVELLDFYG